MAATGETTNPKGSQDPVKPAEGVRRGTLNRP